MIAKPPPEQYSNSKIKINETIEEIRTVNEYKNAIIVFDDILGTSISKYLDQFSIRDRHKNLDMYYLSHSYFDFPKRSLMNISRKIFLFNQTLKNKENMYRDVIG